MHNFTANPQMKALMERAHAERNAAIRELITGLLFAWKAKPETAAAQPA